MTQSLQQLSEKAKNATEAIQRLKSSSEQVTVNYIRLPLPLLLPLLPLSLLKKKINKIKVNIEVRSGLLEIPQMIVDDLRELSSPGRSLKSLNERADSGKDLIKRIIRWDLMNVIN